MPDRNHPDSIAGLFNELFEKVRVLERMVFFPDDPAEIVHQPIPSSYTWQSSVALETGYGHRLAADRNGEIIFIRAERSEGDGDSEAVFDVELDGNSLFYINPMPTVPAGEVVGPEVIPDFATPSASTTASIAWDHLVKFKRGQTFRINVLDTGGGTGPLRVTIFYRSLPPVAPTRSPTRGDE